MSADSPEVRPPRRGSRLLLYIAGPLVLLLGVFICIRVFGYVSGVEFSPYTFKQRRFYYYEIPGLELQVASVKHKVIPIATIDYLRQNSMLPPAGTEDRWDLISGRRGTSKVFEGDADILVAYLSARDQSRQFVWVSWTKNAVPAEARYLWNSVATVCQQGLYIMLPDLFQVASTAGRNPLRNQLNQVMVARYTELALIKQRNGEHEMAVELFDYALAIDANYKLAAEGKQRSVSVGQ